MQRIGFLLLNGFALMSTAAAMEPLRAANLFAPTPIFELTALCQTGRHATSSLGAEFPAIPVSDAGHAFDIVFVVAGGEPMSQDIADVTPWLRALDRAGVGLGGISGGAAILARAGLLGYRRFTVHWHHIEAVRQAFPSLLVERRLYVIDRDRYTCAGGTAPLDMMHTLIAARHGAHFARQISDWFLQTDVRAAETLQRREQEDLPSKGAVAVALELMDSHLSDPLDLPQLASLAGLSPRQLQRHFQTTLGQSVMAYYKGLRLDTAQTLVVGSDLPLAMVAEMTGFATLAAFSDSYRARFGQTASAARRQK